MALEEKVFKLRKGMKAPIKRVQAYKVLNKAATLCGIDEVGTHTLRKTFGYWHYKQFGDIGLLMELFNHSSASSTLDYIGINQDLMDNSVKEFFL